ncbi:DUF692 family protein [Candidatus Parcubacteria bacterium]|nr:MAG: DUF692 family protein [Candidatus Parcubacteria bacterium]
MIPTLAVGNLITTENWQEVPGIEALEYHSPEAFLLADFPTLLHLGMGGVQQGFEEVLTRSRCFMADNRVELFSFDMGPAAPDVLVEDYFFVAPNGPLGWNDLRDIMCRSISAAQDACKGANCVALENLNRFRTSAYDNVCDPGFICEVLEETNAGLVLDLAHARITAENEFEELEKYLYALPLERVFELHLSEPGVVNGTWRDLHGAPQEETWTLLRRLRIRLPDRFYCVIEYDGCWETLKRCHERLAEEAICG